jgi:hypothetical protein
MLRSAFAILLAAPLVAGIKPAPSVDPPSSFEPDDPRGVVALTHEGARVKACKLDASKPEKKKCNETRANVEGSVSIVLRPVGERRIAGPDPRKPVSVSVARQAKQLELQVGDWELEWSGYAKRERFEVADGSEFAVKLATTQGRCRLQKNECSLVADSISRKIEIPSERRR